MISRRSTWIAYALLAQILIGFLQGNLVKLVSKCAARSGIGRCTSMASSCLDVGGIIDQELEMPAGEKAIDSCGQDEVCCLIPNLAVEESCRVCGKKGQDRQLRKSNLERSLNVASTVSDRLRYLRSVSPMTEKAAGAKSRIMNGVDARQNEWCWQAAILNVDGTLVGSGSLIDGRHVVTAAHKVLGKNISDLVIVLGQHNFADPIVNSPTSPTVWYAKPQEIIIHDRYNTETMDNNIALIRIPLISCNSANICPVCLNDVNNDVDYMSEMTNCYITGWGATNTQSTSPVLQEARVKLLKMNDCRQQFAAVGLADLELPYSALCATGTMIAFNTTTDPAVISTCAGDGGGPLVCEFNDGRWRLMGMIAMGLDDCKLIRVSAPTVFVNVGLYLDWIDMVIHRRSPKPIPPPQRNEVWIQQELIKKAEEMNRRAGDSLPTRQSDDQSATGTSQPKGRGVFGRSLNV